MTYTVKRAGKVFDFYVMLPVSSEALKVGLLGKQNRTVKSWLLIIHIKHQKNENFFEY